MNKKKIWCIHHYAGTPDYPGGHRPYYLAKYFQKFGFDVYVIAADFHHWLRKKEATQTEQLRFSNEKKVPFIWIKTNQYLGNGIKRFLNMLSYTIKVWLFKNKIVKVTGKPDVVIVSSPHIFQFLAGYRIAKKYSAKLIFEVRDIWPLSLLELTNFSKYNPLMLFMGWIEKFAYRKSEHVVSLLPQAYKHMLTKGLKLEKFL